MKLRVLTLNIHKGISWDGKRVILDDLKTHIKSQQADIILLQEVVGENLKKAKKYKDWPVESQLEYLADETWSHYSYARNAVYDHGHHGSAILSRFPIIDWNQRDVSTNRFEQRGVLYAKVDLKGESSQFEYVHVYCLHLNLFQWGRRKQLKLIRQRILNEVGGQEPVILAGDFNDWEIVAPKVLEHEGAFKEVFDRLHGKLAKTFPVQFPILSLDRIYYRNLSPFNAERLNQRPWRDLSDHSVLIADFET